MTEEQLRHLRMFVEFTVLKHLVSESKKAEAEASAEEAFRKLNETCKTS